MTSGMRVQHSNWSSRIGTSIVLLVFMALAAAPFWAGRADLRLLAEIFSYIALASLWNLLAGYAGLVSVGQQAYVGLGAYVLFAIATLGGVHPLVAIPIAGAAAAIVSVPTTYASSTRRRISVACSTVFSPGANCSHSSCPK